MQIVNSMNSKNSYLMDNSMANSKISVTKNIEAHEKPSSKQGSLVVNDESYVVFISSEARMMVSTKKGEGSKLIVSSEKDRENLLSMLDKNEKKIVNQDIKKFCEDNGIDMSKPIEALESYVVVETEEMKRKKAMNRDASLILSHARCFVDAFKGGDLIGKYPPEAIYKMYEKRFDRYVQYLTDYVDKYGKDPELMKEIEAVLAKKNPDGTNEVANLVKEITDRIYSGKGDTVHQLIKDKAREAYVHTYKDEIAAATEAEAKRREKFQNRMKKMDEQIENQRESLKDQIKKLQEKILEEEKNLAASGKTENDKIRFMKKELEILQQRLSGLSEDGGMPSDNQNWDDVSVLNWGL